MAQIGHPSLFFRMIYLDDRPMIFHQISILDTLHTFSHFTGRHGIPKMKILVLNIYLIAKIYDENLSQLLYTKMILYLKKTRTSAKNYRKKSKLKN